MHIAKKANGSRSGRRGGRRGKRFLFGRGLLLFALAAALTLGSVSCSGAGGASSSGASSAADPGASEPSSRTSASSAAYSGTSSDASSQTPLLKVPDGICLREGSDADGKIILASGDFLGFRRDYFEPTRSDRLIFELTDAGKEAQAQATAGLTGGSVSLWLGKDKLTTLSVEAPVTGGSFAIVGNDADGIKSIYDRLTGGAG